MQLRYTQRQNIKSGVLWTDSKGYAIGLYIVKGKLFFIYNIIILLVYRTQSNGGLEPPGYATDTWKIINNGSNQLSNLVKIVLWAKKSTD